MLDEAFIFVFSLSFSNSRFVEFSAWLIGSAQGCVVLQCGFWGQLILTCICAVSTVLGDLAPCPPSLSGKYEASIMVPLFLQCDGAWWLPLTGLSWLPYNSAIVQRVVMFTVRAWLLCSRLHYLSRHRPQAHQLLMSLIAWHSRWSIVFFLW